MNRTAESYQASEDLRNRVSALQAERDQLAAELKEEKQLEWEAMGHAARWEEQVEQLHARLKTLEDALARNGLHMDEDGYLEYDAVDAHLIPKQALAAKEPK